MMSSTKAIQHTPEDVSDHALERGGGVDKAKWHHRVLE